MNVPFGWVVRLRCDDLRCHVLCAFQSWWFIGIHSQTLPKVRKYLPRRKLRKFYSNNNNFKAINSFLQLFISIAKLQNLFSIKRKIAISTTSLAMSKNFLISSFNRSVSSIAWKICWFKLSTLINLRDFNQGKGWFL